MTKALEDGRENGLKSNFAWKVLYVNFKVFSRNFNLLCFLAQTRKGLPRGVLGSIRIIKDFQNSINSASFY